MMPTHCQACDEPCRSSGLDPMGEVSGDLAVDDDVDGAAAGGGGGGGGNGGADAGAGGGGGRGGVAACSGRGGIGGGIVGGSGGVLGESSVSLTGDMLSAETAVVSSTTSSWC